MSNLVNMYPYTNFHDVNLDYILKLVRENEGLYLETVGNLLVAKNAAGAIVSSVTIPYATTAGSADSATSANYAATAGAAATAQHAATADTATSATSATEATHAAAADTATTANTATTAASATYATTAGSANNATNAVNAQNAEYATTTGYVEKAGNGIKTLSSTDSGIIITLEGGGGVATTVSKAQKAEKDNLGNTINTTYVASVVNDNGVLKFKNASGTVIASITPSSQTATEDDYGNLIASYIKAIAAGSNYITVTHGDGTTETLTIQYSETAWKDTNGNVIKNFYAGSMECVEDDDTGHYNLVVYNGDTPKAELYRFEIYAYKAQEADHAALAAEADHATTADNATTANVALVANSCKDTNIYIKAYKNGDGTWSSNSPDTMTVESITNSAGETLTWNDLEVEDLTNVILQFHEAPNDPYIRNYTASEFGRPNSSSPNFLYFDHCMVSYDSTIQNNTLDSFHADFVYQNGTLLSSRTYITSDSLPTSVVNVEIKTTDTDPLNLTIGQDSDYETDLDFADIANLLSKGKIVSLKFVDEDDYWQHTALVNGSGSPAVIMLYETGTGPAWFKLGNNSTYIDGVNLERLS